MHVFQLLLGLKVKPVDKIMQSNYLCVILHVKRKKLLILTVFTWFLILGKIQDGGEGGDHCWWRQRPPAAPPPIKYNLSCREHQRLSTEGKIVSKYCIISKTLERGSINQPPWICVYVGGLIDISSPYVWGKLFFHCFFPDFKKIKSTKTTILPIFSPNIHPHEREFSSI